MSLRSALSTLVVGATLLLSPAALAGDLVGTWALDKSASEPVDELLRAQGVGAVKRKMAASIDVELTITRAGDGVTVNTLAAGNARSETIQADGTERSVTNDRGTFQVTASWQGEDLVVVARSADGGSVTTRRSVSDDDKTLTQAVAMKTPDRKTISANRVFRRE